MIDNPVSWLILVITVICISYKFFKLWLDSKSNSRDYGCTTTPYNLDWSGHK